MTEFEPVKSPVSDTLFLVNPSDRLLEALGKTRADLKWRDATNFKFYRPVKDESGFYLLAILASEWPDPKNIKAHEYEATENLHKRTILLDDCPKEDLPETIIDGKKKKKKRPKKDQVQEPAEVAAMK